MGNQHEKAPAASAQSATVPAVAAAPGVSNASMIDLAGASLAPEDRAIRYTDLSDLSTMVKGDATMAKSRLYDGDRSSIALDVRWVALDLLASRLLISEQLWGTDPSLSMEMYREVVGEVQAEMTLLITSAGNMLSLTGALNLQREAIEEFTHLAQVAHGVS